MRSTIIFERGHVVVVSVPFSGQGGVKRRPALVLSAEAFHGALPDLIVCPISSQPRFYSRPGVPLKPQRIVLAHHKLRRERNEPHARL
jgi:mRNA-degrading endonuclease toxin of MazEF toxin-antitoxin module